MNPPIHPSLNSSAQSILRLMAQGLSDKKIAEKLGFSVNTVKWYNRRIFLELQASNRSHAIALARESHLLGLSGAQPRPSTPVHNLPASTTSFVARGQDLTSLGLTMDEARLLTLVGPPGSGKTRLALELARAVQNRFPDGTWYVSLAGIPHAARVLPAIAETLGVTESRGQSLTETLKAALGERSLLLVLDNFEHVLSASLQLGRLLLGCPQLKLLVTSREPLDLYGEHLYTVAPLPLEDSVQLFLARARSAHSGFEVGDEASTVETLCRKLEGLPLAIELAAAKVRVWPLKTLLAKLSQRFDTLAATARDIPHRHQTLRNTIEWSFRLLDPPQQRALLGLAVLRGPTALDQAEPVLDGLGVATASAVLESLVNKSLVQMSVARSGDLQVSLFEMVKEYVLEQAAPEEVSRAESVHATVFRGLANRAASELPYRGYAPWLQVLGQANANLQGALEWLISQPDPQPCAEVVSALKDYWIASSQCLEGGRWTKKVLALRAQLTPAWVAKILVVDSLLGWYTFPAAPHGKESRLLDEAAQLARAAGDRSTEGWALTLKGAMGIGHPRAADEALNFAREGDNLFRAVGDGTGRAMAVCVIGELERNRQKTDAAEEAYQECLKIVRQTGEVRRETMLLINLGFLERDRGGTTTAAQFMVAASKNALEHWYDEQVLVSPLFVMAGVLADRGRPSEGALLLGAAFQFLDSHQIRLQAGDRSACEREAELVRRELTPTEFSKQTALGKSLSPQASLQLVVRVGETLNDEAPPTLTTLLSGDRAG